MRARRKISGPRMKRPQADKPNAAEQRHMDRLAQMPCLVTGRKPVVLHHVMKAPGKRCRRDHRFVVPLVPEMHNMGPDSVHELGSEALFERKHGLRPSLADWAVKEWEASNA